MYTLSFLKFQTPLFNLYLNYVWEKRIKKVPTILNLLNFLITWPNKRSCNVHKCFMPVKSIGNIIDKSFLYTFIFSTKKVNFLLWINATARIAHCFLELSIHYIFRYRKELLSEGYYGLTIGRRLFAYFSLTIKQEEIFHFTLFVVTKSHFQVWSVKIMTSGNGQ